MKYVSMRTLESEESGGSLEAGANAEGFHIVDASGGDSVRLDEGQVAELLGLVVEALSGTEHDASDDAYIRGFSKGFDEGCRRAEREAWEMLPPGGGALDASDPLTSVPQDVALWVAVMLVVRRLDILAKACRRVASDARSDDATSNGPALAAFAHDVATDIEAAIREAEGSK